MLALDSTSSKLLAAHLPDQIVGVLSCQVFEISDPLVHGIVIEILPQME
jgi:hypothetical protein